MNGWPERVAGPGWRVFPWHAGAVPGSRFSPSHVPEPTGRGRFDLPRDLSPVLYVAATPDHAVGELLQPWRGHPLEPSHLTRAGATPGHRGGGFGRHGPFGDGVGPSA